MSKFNGTVLNIKDILYMSGNHSRNKGANFERALCRAAKEAGLEATRSAPLQTFKENNEPDLYIESYKVEAKKYKSNFPSSKIVEYLKENDIVIVGLDRCKPFAAISLEKLFDFINKENKND